jgi:hypothetical protein
MAKVNGGVLVVLAILGIAWYKKNSLAPKGWGTKKINGVTYKTYTDTFTWLYLKKINDFTTTTFIVELDLPSYLANGWMAA